MIQQLRTIIAEDNKKTLEYLEGLVRESNDLVLISSANSVKKAIAEINSKKSDLILMDVDLGDGSAFDVLENFPNPEFNVIFITAHQEYIQKALDYYAFHFLNKPLDEKKFRDVVKVLKTKRERLFNQFNFRFLKSHIENANTNFLLHLGSNYIVIDLDEVIFCRSDGNYTMFHFVDGIQKLANYALKFYSLQFKDRGFLRVSRFHLINTKNIKSIQKKETIVMRDGSKIQIATRNKEIISSFIKNYNNW